MPARSRIVFTGGTELEVDGTPAKVRGKLSRGKPYAKFASGSGEVHVHRAQVAYVAPPDAVEPARASAGEESFRSALRQRPRKARSARGAAGALRGPLSTQPAS